MKGSLSGTGTQISFSWCLLFSCPLPQPKANDQDAVGVSTHKLVL